MAAVTSMLVTLVMLGLVIKGVRTGEPDINGAAGDVVMPVLLICNVAAVASIWLSNRTVRAKLATYIAPPVRPQTLRMKVHALGEVAGRSYGEVVAALGPAKSVSSIGGKLLVQWLEGGFHISLLFDGGSEGSKCLGIKSIHSV